MSLYFAFDTYAIFFSTSSMVGVWLGSDLGNVLIYKKNAASLAPIFGLEPPF
jgi:hypothetical protein